VIIQFHVLSIFSHSNSNHPFLIPQFDHLSVSHPSVNFYIPYQGSVSSFTPSQSLFSLSSRYMILTSALAMSAATRPLHRAK
jgi:hypothetical protein